MRCLKSVTEFTTLLGSFLGIAPAQADWRFTRWGMTPAEVISASGGMAVPRKPLKVPDGLTAKLTSDYLASGMAFKATYIFDQNERLVSVSLDLLEHEKCPVLLESLFRRYGPTTERYEVSGLSFTTWRDKKSGNTIGYSRFSPTQCGADYRAYAAPIPSGDL